MCLGHARLSIIDLSPAGLQPLHSKDGQLHAAVNGEIYDHDAIRARCAAEHGYDFSGRSDSEVVLALYRHHGAPGFLDHLRGEFAFVLHDERSGDVIAARDRFGIKPLFWTRVNNDDNDDDDDDDDDGALARILVASEIKAFLPMGWRPEWDVAAIASGAAMQGEGTLFKGVKKVLPGHWMRFARDGSVKQHRYWDANYGDKSVKETRTLEEMTQGVRDRLVEAVRLRLQADVPVGIYLSGGIDSSIVAGITTQLVRERGIKLGSRGAEDQITCFSISFTSDSAYNEYDIAERTAKWLDVAIVEKAMDEAELARHFADSVYHTEHHHYNLNSVGKHALSELPRLRGIPVVLTGEGADEHFAGYPFLVSDLLREPDAAFPSSPLDTDAVFRAAFLETAEAQLRTMFNIVGMFDHPALDDGNPDFWPLAGLDSFWAQLRSHPSNDVFAPWVRRATASDGLDAYAAMVDALPADARQNMLTRWHALHSALYLYLKTSMANMVLTCLGDRSEMAHSIEARLPFLDHELAEYVNGLPPSVKMSYRHPEEGDDDGRATRGQGAESLFWNNMAAARDRLIDKKILRDAGRPFITDEIYHRKKHPYSAPSKWPVGGPMQSMFQDLLTKEAVDQLGFVDYDVVSSSLRSAFGTDGDLVAFRKLLVVGAWVVLSQRFGIRPAGEPAF
ncbi:asparagine synthetase [Colletotrichum tabaci]|uniref:Asparagine synthetase n=1 Tax=Colletotrichum tabaci TaxID=1209068 RepID=A0AAV9STU8_9PEZI